MTKSREAFRKELGIPGDRPIVGVVGRLQPWKGQHHLLRLVAQLRSGGFDAHGLIVGGSAYGLSPDYEPYLRRLAEDLGITQAVTFTGQVADAQPYMRLMDVFVNTSAGEPFGIALLEAMRAGVPVVAFADGGPREIIEHELTGMLVHPHCDEDLTNAVERLLCSPDLRMALIANAHRRLDERFSAAPMAKNLDWYLHRYARANR